MNDENIIDYTYTYYAESGIKPTISFISIACLSH